MDNINDIKRKTTKKELQEKFKIRFIHSSFSCPFCKSSSVYRQKEHIHKFLPIQHICCNCRTVFTAKRELNLDEELNKK
jgi:transposase-like protein